MSLLAASLLAISCATAPAGLFFSPTGIGIGGVQGPNESPTDGKVADRPGPVTALAVSPQRDSLLTGDVNGRVGLYSITKGELKLVRLLEWADERAQPPAVETILWTADAVYVACDEGTIGKATPGLRGLTEVARHPEGSRDLVAGPEGLIASAGQSGDVRIFAPKGEGLALVEVLLAHRVATVALAYEPDERKPRLWSVGWDGRLCAWRWPKASKRAKPKKAGFRGRSSSSRASAPRLSKPRLEVELGLREPTGLSLLPPAPDARGRADEPRLFVSDFQGRVHQVEVARRRLKPHAYPERLYMELLTGVHLAPLAKDAAPDAPRKGVAIASAEQTLLTFDPADPSQKLRRLKILKTPPARACFLDADTLVLGFYDGHVELVEVN